MARFVLDSLLAASWFFPDADSFYARGVRRSLESGCTAVVPPIWQIEVVNILTEAIREKFPNKSAAEFLLIAAKLPIQVEHSSTHQLFERVPYLAQIHRISCYDAAYLEVASRLGLPLATENERMLAIAARMGIVAYEIVSEPVSLPLRTA